MAPLGGLLCCCDCRRLIPFRLWPWGQRAEGRTGMGRGRQDVRKARSKEVRRRRLRKSPELNTISEGARVLCLSTAFCSLANTSQEDEPALFAASTGTALHYDTAGTSNKPTPSITTTTCPQLQLPTFDQDQELFPSINCSAPATVEPAHSAGGAAAEPKEVETSVVPHLAAVTDEVVATAIST